MIFKPPVLFLFKPLNDTFFDNCLRILTDNKMNKYLFMHVNDRRDRLIKCTYVTLGDGPWSVAAQ